MSDQNPDREKLAELIENARTPMGGTLLGSREQFEAVADAILNSEWLADLIRRERGVGWAECSKARRFGLKNNPYTREQETP